MISLGVPFLKYETILERACAFLREHNALDSIPVNIEAIVEFELGIGITTMPNLQRDFGTEGFTSSDFSTIYVDEGVFWDVPVRYRSTLAHEIGHLVLHQQLLAGVYGSGKTPVLWSCCNLLRGTEIGGILTES